MLSAQTGLCKLARYFEILRVAERVNGAHAHRYDPGWRVFHLAKKREVRLVKSRLRRGSVKAEGIPGWFVLNFELCQAV